MNKQVKQIRNEVERLIKWCNAPFTKRAGVSGEEILNNLLSFIDSIEEPEVDLEKEIIRVSKNEYFDFTDWKSIARHFYELGRSYWQKDNLWKPADGDDLPEIDREVIALVGLEGFFEIPPDEPVKLSYKVVFAHRPPEYWDGKNILTGKVTRNYTKRYDKGGWNQPNVKWWLDLDLPMEE